MEYIKEFNGNWGSGKTFLGEHDLKAAIENIEIHEKNNIYFALWCINA